MHDCKIPVNVQKRRNEHIEFSDALNALKSGFDDMIQIDETYSGTTKTK